MATVLTSPARPWISPMLLAAAVVAPAAGCSSDIAPDGRRTEIPRGEENLLEVAVGAFRVPLVGWDRQLEVDGQTADRNRLLLRFELFALVPPSRQSAVLHRIKTHEARLRDEVTQVCRTASLDELSDPALVTLKMQLTDVVARYVGPQHLRRLVLSHVMLEAT